MRSLVLFPVYRSRLADASIKDAAPLGSPQFEVADWAYLDICCCWLIAFSSEAQAAAAKGMVVNCCCRISMKNTAMHVHQSAWKFVSTFGYHGVWITLGIAILLNCCAPRRPHQKSRGCWTTRRPQTNVSRQTNQVAELYTPSTAYLAAELGQ
jgi:hypothetical protein